MSPLFAGIDGGQSSTVAVIGDDRGNVLARAAAGPADEVGQDATSTRLADALQAALRGACRQAGLPGETEFAAIVAGVSGYEGRVRGRGPDLPTPRLVLMHDAPIAHAGALGGEPGVVVIAGTGSVVYGCDERGGAQTLGGWGFLFGDEGSAFRIAAGALALMMRAEDDGDPALWEAARAAGEFFEAGSLRQIARAFYAGTIARERLAAFAPAAMRFEPFRALAYCGADRLAALARRALAPMRSKNVALSGGLFADAGFYERVSGAILTAVPGAQIRRAKYDPAAGALLLAYRECEMPIAELSP